MPLNTQDLRQNKSTVDVYKVLGVKQLAGKLLVEHYVRSDMLMDDQIALEARADELRRAGNMDGLAELFAKQIIAHVASWDYYTAPPENGGEPVPLTVEDIRRHVPLEVTQDVIQAVNINKRPMGEARGR